MSNQLPHIEHDMIGLDKLLQNTYEAMELIKNEDEPCFYSASFTLSDKDKCYDYYVSVVLEKTKLGFYVVTISPRKLYKKGYIIKEMAERICEFSKIESIYNQLIVEFQHEQGSKG